MKIRLLSDLHLEGHNYYYEYAGEDVVVLAGDIHTQNQHRFILEQIPHDIKIIMVAGNHEYYGKDFDSVNDFLCTNMQAAYPNFYFLNNKSINIDGVSFFGGTMFTDWQLSGDSWTAKQIAKNSIADFHWIDKITKDGNRRWNVEDHLQEHLTFKENLKSWINTPAEKRVVISHFVPHPDGSDPKFAGSPLNPYFLCDMREYMKDINLWLYGHTHTSKDIMEDNCRLVCNPRGYGDENKEGWIKDLIVEI